MDVPVLSSPSTRRLAQAWLSDVEVLTQRLLAAIFTDNPEWTDYASVPRDDLHEGCLTYLTRVLEVLSGKVAGPAPDDEVVAAIARHRAVQGVPLEVMLRTFRLGGRIVWEALLEQAQATGIPPDAVLEAGTAMWTVIDGLSSALSTSYRNSELDRVRRDEQRRLALVEDLLGSRAGDAGFAERAARELNLPSSGSYLIVVARVTAEGVSALAGPQTALDAFGIRSLWHTRIDNVVGLVALEHRAPAEVLDRLRTLVRGAAAASPAVSGLAEAGKGHAFALIALGTVPEDAKALVSLDERYPEALLVRSPELTRHLVDHALGGVLALPERERETLLRTLAVWLEENRSAAHAATRLHCHRNTVLNRLQRITTLLGHSLDGHRAHVELSLALAALDLP
ncbi:PucR family transcriptional regulator [Amycolatopsis acidicola]|uniref:PucR family transcriptional regulator n=1 Tax=Amycolatopsis acidicola TaxID=2596893 RepID=A0A5N0V929_9PSEU|nr:helix-turn-helix domain-containing protein [Amycolatopsis acidicola]KAA9162018.1 PucR family transcriptional regulator [Amycolatopsis acidicola]